jgi:N-acyl-phosphatidylethanolamine-hydrolysing phospholipase D
MKAMASRRITGKGNNPDTTPPTVPVRTPTFLPDRTTPKLRATWLGHACYLVEFPSGLRVLFDPVFEDRCSPFSWLGPKRYTPKPCNIADIPLIDAVVISHNHYDHLSHPTVLEISKTHPQAHFFVPLGNKKWFAACGITQCTELDWWDQVDFTLTPQSQSEKRISTTSSTPSITKPASTSHPITATISCLPCQHISARSLTDRAATLWSSWSIRTDTSNVYFAGDTGYRAVPRESEGEDDWGEAYANLPHCPAFKDVGQFRGPFDLGLIPIGAYMPRWIMSPMHANPRDSVEIFRDTKCKKALGMHWGTWVLTEEDVLEPPEKLKEALKLHGIAETGVFDICDIGESREFESGEGGR